jgi:hypothetical protein
MTEQELQALVLEHCGRQGLLAHHCRDSRHCDGPRGFPDLIAVGAGRLIVAELKSDDGRWNRDQLEYRARFRAAGIDVLELRPGNWSTKLADLTGRTGQ